MLKICVVNANGKEVLRRIDGLYAFLGDPLTKI